MLTWFIFNESGEIISEGYPTEEEAQAAMQQGEYDPEEVPNYIDGIDI